MAVAWDSTGAGNRTTGTSASLATSWSHTVVQSGPMTVVIAAITQSVTTNSTSTTCTVTYGGVPMTQYYYEAYGSGTNRAGYGIYFLFNPPTGAQTVQATSGGTSTKVAIAGQTVAYTGVGALTQLAKAATRGGTVNCDVPSSMAICVTVNGAALSSPSNTSRYLAGASVSGLGDYICVQDATYSEWITFTVSGTNSTPRATGFCLSPGGYAKMNTLVDEFSSLNTTKWYNGGAVAVSGGALNVPVDNTYSNGMLSIANYDFTDCAIVCQLLQAPNTGNNSTEFFFGALNGEGGNVGFNGTYIYINTGYVMAAVVVGGVRTVSAGVLYNTTDFKWLRISESGGAINFQYSPDGNSWSTLMTSTPGLKMTGMRATIQCGYWGTESDPGTAILDNFNLLGNTNFVNVLWE